MRWSPSQGVSRWRSQSVISSFAEQMSPVVSQFVTPPRDIHSELADLNEEAATLAAKIQGNFEGLAV
jgi:hypothetical protein